MLHEGFYYLNKMDVLKSQAFNQATSFEKCLVSNPAGA